MVKVNFSIPAQRLSLSTTRLCTVEKLKRSCPVQIVIWVSLSLSPLKTCISISFSESRTRSFWINQHIPARYVLPTHTLCPPSMHWTMVVSGLPYVDIGHNRDRLQWLSIIIQNKNKLCSVEFLYIVKHLNLKNNSVGYFSYLFDYIFTSLSFSPFQYITIYTYVYILLPLLLSAS